MTLLLGKLDTFLDLLLVPCLVCLVCTVVEWTGTVVCCRAARRIQKRLKWKYIKYIRILNRPMTHLDGGQRWRNRVARRPVVIEDGNADNSILRVDIWVEGRRKVCEAECRWLVWILIRERHHEFEFTTFPVSSLGTEHNTRPDENSVVHGSSCEQFWFLSVYAKYIKDAFIRFHRLNAWIRSQGLLYSFSRSLSTLTWARKLEKHGENFVLSAKFRYEENFYFYLNLPC